jgi:hypothetical protein
MLITTVVAAVAAGISLATAASAPGPTAPPVDASVDYQLGGAYPLPDGVRVVTRDRTARPAPAAYNICYVNAFQTQPGALAWWRSDHPELLLRRGGRLVHDPGWPGEVLLDTSTAANRGSIARVIGHWIARCGNDGFDAVEPDNLDSFTRSHGLLSRPDALDLAARMADIAHRQRLAIAQKNLAGLSRERRVMVGFDFAVSEECAVWHECGAYRRAYGRHVIEIEYTDNGRKAFRRACRDHGDAWSIVLRDRDLRRPSSPQYAYRRC